MPSAAHAEHATTWLCVYAVFRFPEIPVAVAPPKAAHMESVHHPTSRRVWLRNERDRCMEGRDVEASTLAQQWVTAPKWTWPGQPGAGRGVAGRSDRRGLRPQQKFASSGWAARSSAAFRKPHDLTGSAIGMIRNLPTPKLLWRDRKPIGPRYIPYRLEEYPHTM